MTKLYEILYENLSVAFIKEKVNGVKKCQRCSFSEEIPEISFIVPTPVYDKFGKQIRIDNKSKTIKSLIKKLTEELNETDLDKKSIQKTLQTYIDISNNSKPIFKIVNSKEIEEV